MSRQVGSNAAGSLWLPMDTIERLPAGQRALIILRDMEGCEAEEAFTPRGISAENQRVLLHRARDRIRQTIDMLTGAAQTAAMAAPARRSGGGRGGGSLGRRTVRARSGWRSLFPVPAQPCLGQRAPPLVVTPPVVALWPRFGADAAGDGVE